MEGGTLALAAVVVAVLTAGGCSAAQQRGDGFTLDDARAFDEFALFYAGDSVAGLPLETIQRNKYRTVNDVTFIYGTCEPSGGEGGCAPPLEVQVWSACARNPSMYGGPLNPAPPPTTVRGVPAADWGGRLEIQTADATVVIFAWTRELARAAAEALEGLNVAVAPGAPLPAPVPGALDGTLECPPGAIVCRGPRLEGCRRQPSSPGQSGSRTGSASTAVPSPTS